jgi:hypothetical protein
MDTWTLWILQERLANRRLGGEIYMDDVASVSTEHTLCSELTAESIINERIEVIQDYLDSLDPEEDDDDR